MKKYLSEFVNYIFKLESKIAFYPALLSLFGLISVFLMLYIESKGVSGYLSKHAPVLVVNDTETARSLLTTFIAGLISIMVFSFSMVMILLNQASSNFSPRILPGLISNRRHQIILGIYNFTLLYCIFILVSIEPNGEKYQLPGFSVLLAIFAMTFCLAAFIYFIHSISQEIQINNIMDRIFDTAVERLNTLIASEKNTTSHFPDTSKWYVANSSLSGYYQDISAKSIKEIVTEHNLKLEIIPIKGSYILKESPLFKSEEELEESVKKEISNIFHFSKSELISDNYVLAYKQITEVAVKAMSPGVNDPGTAVNAIDYLTELLLLRLQKLDTSIIYNNDDRPVVKINTVHFEDLLFQVMAPLRTYCKHDITIVQKLFMMLNILKSSTDIRLDIYKKAIDQELDNLLEDAEQSMKSKTDLIRIKRMHIKF